MFLKVIPFFLIMLYLIGLGLDRNGISKEGQLILSKCHKVYLEGYTVDFPYNESELHLGKNRIYQLQCLSRIGHDAMYQLKNQSNHVDPNCCR